MRKRRPTILWRSLRRRICAAVALVAYLTAAVGMPLPASTLRTGGMPFPCQYLLCGCENAAQCNDCGCFTPEQRAAWTRTEGTETPPCAEKPAESVQAVAASAEKTDQEEPAEKTCCCCAGKNVDGCSMPCCRNKGREAGCAARKPNAPAPQDFLPPALALGALKCRGVATLWVSAGAVPPSEPPLSCQPCMPAPDRINRIDHFAIARHSIPLEPPPRPRCV
jgi:hypothetical protein